MGPSHINSGTFTADPNGRKAMGRPPGIPNKSTALVKGTFMMVFQKLQEDPDDAGPSLEAWARRETTEFYKIASKLIPLEIEAKVRNVITVKITDDEEDEYGVAIDDTEYVEYEEVRPDDLI